jgi:hypothetical protein
MNAELSEPQLQNIYDLVFLSVHSDGFRRAEVKDLLFDDEYFFIEKTKEKWEENLMNYLKEINFDTAFLYMNPKILKNK